MPWTGRLYKLAVAGNITDSGRWHSVFALGVLCLFSWIFFAQDWHGFMEHGVRLGQKEFGIGLTLASRSIPSGL